MDNLLITKNNYVSSKITYTFGDHKETIDGSIINKWLKTNENFEVIVSLSTYL